MAKQGDGAAQAAREEQLDDASLAAAIEATEREIFEEVTGEEPAENDGDTSLEAVDDPAGGDPEAEDDAEGEDEPVEAELSPEGEVDEGEEGEQPPEPERPQRRGDPAVALREERDRRQALEREIAELRGQIAGVASAVRAPPQQHEQPERPDMFVDPEGYTAAIQREATERAVQQVREQQINASFAETREEHGEEFDFAYQQLTSLPRTADSAAIVRKIVSSPNPGAAMMRWAEDRLAEFRDQRAQEQAERFDRMLEESPEFREHVISRLNGRPPRQPAGQRPPPTQQRTQRRLPSLNGAGGSSSQRVGADPRGFDGSESSIFDYAFQE